MTKQLFNYTPRQEVIIVDDIMGSGKTSFALQLIRQAPMTQKFIFITPYLDEIERVKTITREYRNDLEPIIRDNKQSKMHDTFHEPTVKGNTTTKLQSLKNLLNKGRNICSTHALFRSIDQEILDLLLLHDYTLILDEVMDVVEKVEISNSDIQMLIHSKQIEVDPVDSKVIWTGKEYSGKFESLKNTILTEKVFLHNGSAFIWTFPIEIFERFKQVYILTYMFDSQIQSYYFQSHGLGFTKKCVGIKEPNHSGHFSFGIEKGHFRVSPEYELTEYKQSDIKSMFRHLVIIEEDDNLNYPIGRPINKWGHDALTFSKMTKMKKSSPMYKPMKNNLYNWLKNRQKAKSSDVIWTCPKDTRKLINPRGYGTAFLSSNTRATNEFGDRTIVAYMLNRYMNPSIVGFFENQGITVDQDMFALSELVQWLFRSAIRNGQEIQLFIPSKRMRMLLKAWLNNEI